MRLAIEEVNCDKVMKEFYASQIKDGATL